MKQFHVARTPKGDEVTLTNGKGKVLKTISLVSYEEAKETVVTEIKALACGSMFIINSCPFDSKGVKI